MVVISLSDLGVCVWGGGGGGSVNMSSELTRTAKSCMGCKQFLSLTDPGHSC